MNSHFSLIFQRQELFMTIRMKMAVLYKDIYRWKTSQRPIVLTKLKSQNKIRFENARFRGSTLTWEELQIFYFAKILKFQKLHHLTEIVISIILSLVNFVVVDVPTTRYLYTEITHVI